MHESAYGSFNGSASALSFLKNVLNAPIYRLAAFLLIMLAGLSASSFIVSEVLVLNADSENLAYASRTSYSANVVWPSSASGKVAGSTTEMVVWGGLKNAEIANGTLVSKSPCNCGVEDAQAVSSKAV